MTHQPDLFGAATAQTPTTTHGCMLCNGSSTGCAFCSPERKDSAVPAWLGPSATPTQRQHVLAGRHPLGTPMTPAAPTGATCGTCDHLELRQTGSRRFFKCALTKQSSGPATDTRRRWLACTHWILDHFRA